VPSERERLRRGLILGREQAAAAARRMRVRYQRIMQEAVAVVPAVPPPAVTPRTWRTYQAGGVVNAQDLNVRGLREGDTVYWNDLAIGRVTAAGQLEDIRAQEYQQVPPLEPVPECNCPGCQMARERLARWYGRHEQERRRQRERQEAEARERQEAQARAEALLRRLLNPIQREQLDGTGCFDVEGSAGGRYRIGKGSLVALPPLGRAMVARLGYAWSGSIPARAGVVLCVYASLGDLLLPEGDQMLAKKLTLETDEPELVAVANPMGVVSVAG
jgi:hypothetical protein